MSVASDAPSIGRAHSRAGAISSGPTARLARRAFADGRRRTIAFGLLFAFVAYIQPVSYRHEYPDQSQRLAFARSFGDNKAIRLFYGVPHDLLTVGGYTAWRVGGILAVFAAVWGSFAAVAALRGEEDSGRSETLLALPVGRRVLDGSALSAIAASAVVLWAFLLVGLLAAGLAGGGSLALAVAVIAVAPVFVGVGALASQLAATRRRALELSLGVLVLTFLIRVVADTVSGVGWLRWLSPLGWAEEIRPFAGARPWVLVLPLLATAALVLGALRIARERDIGTGLMKPADSRDPRLGLLSSPGAQAVREDLSSLAAWLIAVGWFALIVGVISRSISSAGISASLRAQFAKLGAGSIITPSGYLGFAFLLFVLAVSLFACSQIGAARTEELQGRLETVFALPVGRRRWLVERLVVAVGGILVISLAAGVLAWLGAAIVGVTVSFPRLMLASVNCVTVATLFLGIGAAAYALAPRIGAAIAYAAVTAAFLWQLFGSLLGAPSWLVRLSPFEHIGLVPDATFKPGAGAVMVLIGVACAAVAALCLGRRDIMAG